MYVPSRTTIDDPGAHGRLPVGPERYATAAEKHPETWREQVLTAGHALITNTPLSLAEQADEALLMGLRLTAGLDLQHLQKFGGATLDTRTIQHLCDLGLLQLTGTDHIHATCDGRLVLNAVIAELSRTLRLETKTFEGSST